MALDPVTTGLAAVQAGLGIYQAISGGIKSKRLMQQRRAYQTPDEIFKMLNLSLSQAGGDTATRDFMTGQVDRNFSQGAGILSRYGDAGDVANDLSFMFNQKMNQIMKVGQEFHASNMEAFSKVLGAYNIVADNAAAEWRSKEDILKDKLQAAAADKAQGIQNIANAANTFIGAQSASKTQDLYKERTDMMTPASTANRSWLNMPAELLPLYPTGTRS